MKFMVQFAEDTSLSAKFTTPAMFEMLETSRSYLEDLRKREKVTDYGFFGVGHGLYAVFSVKSVGELHELCSLLPLRALCTVTPTAVIESGEFADMIGKIKREATIQWERHASIGRSKINNVA